MAISRGLFGTMPDGKDVNVYTLRNSSGMRVDLIELGAIITKIEVPDKSGKIEDVTLGYDHLHQYLSNPNYFGAIIGRFANRIAGGKFFLDGKQYTLATNNGSNALHGGNHGFDKKHWISEMDESGSTPMVRLMCFSPDGEEGYPGNLSLTVTYSLTEDNGLRIDYLAESDNPTPCNLTNHTYFNLAGAGSGPVLEHELWLKSHAITPVDENQIPNGEKMAVENTPFDFTTASPIGKRIDEDNEQLKFGGGYDHNWALDTTSHNPELVGSLFEPDSGRLMNIFSTEPGIQVYTGNFLNEPNGKSGKGYTPRSAVALELQHFPDSPNKPDFPHCILRPGKSYRQTTEYRFSLR